MQSQIAGSAIELITDRLNYATHLHHVRSTDRMVAKRTHGLIFGFCLAFLFLLPTLDCQKSSVSGQESLNQPSEILPAPLQGNLDGAINQEEDPRNVLMSGPMHEAFLEVHQADPVPNAIIEKQPPEPINELPPEFKPEGLNVQWIPGYWGWDFEKEDFVWVSGVWRDIPPDRQWIPGYWHQVETGFQWISGYWQVTSEETIDYLPEPPASIDTGPSTVAPGADYFYVPGNWVMHNTSYRWSPGYWQRSVANWIWSPARYIWSPHGCIYRPGYWDRAIDRRGVLFAPVYYSQPYYRAVGYRLRPRYVINVGLRLLPHLFVSLRHGHYYYGDWYANSFRRHGVYPWIDAHRHHRRYYDPLQVYYSSPSQRYQNRNSYSWARDHHHHVTKHSHLRPSRDFTVIATGRGQSTLNRPSGRKPQQHVSIGIRYSDFVKSKARSGHQPSRAQGQVDSPHYYRNFKQLSKSEVLNEVRRAKPIQQIKVARRTHEAGKPNRASSSRGSSKNPQTRLRIDSLAKSAVRNPGPSRDRNDAFRFSGKSKSSASPDRSRSSLTLKGRADANGRLQPRSNSQSSAGSKSATGPRQSIGTRQSKASGATLANGRDRSQGRQSVPGSRSGTSSNKILAPRTNGRIAEPFQPRGSSGSVNRDRGTGRQKGGNGPTLTRPDSKSRGVQSSGRAGSSLGSARSGSDTTRSLPGLSNRSRQLGTPSRSASGTLQQPSRTELQRSRESAATIFQKNSSRNMQVQDAARRQLDESRRASARATQDAKSRADSARRLIESQRKRFVPTPSTSTRNSSSAGSLFKKSTTQKVSPQRSSSSRFISPRTTSPRTTSPRAVPQRKTSQRSTFQTPRLQKSSSQSSTLQRSGSQRSSSQRSIIQRSKSQPSIQQRSRSSAGRGRGSGRSRRK